MKKIEINTYQKPLLFDYNGFFDDFLALTTLLTLSEYRLVGLTIVKGDCCVDPVIDATLRILKLFCRNDIQIAVGESALINPFPFELRNKCLQISSIKKLAGQKIDNSQLETTEAAQFIAQKINEQTEKTTVVVSGPAVNIANAIEQFPHIVEKIEKVIWVAGAFLADGDVVAPDHDGSAEWNIFCHPAASQVLLKSNVPVYMIPLDITHQLPIDNYLIYHLDKNKKKTLSKIGLKILQPEFDPRASNYMNSVVAPVYLGDPDIFNFETKSIAIEQRGTSMGNIYRTSLGNRIKQANFVEAETFYDFLIKQLKQF